MHGGTLAGMKLQNFNVLSYRNFLDLGLLRNASVHDFKGLIV